MACSTAASGLCLKPANRLASQVQSRRTSRAPLRTRQVTRALSDTNLIISGATAVSLALGRFVFLDFQRDNVRRQGLPVQNGITHREAGDKFAEEASFLK